MTPVAAQLGYFEGGQGDPAAFFVLSLLLRPASKTHHFFDEGSIIWWWSPFAPAQHECVSAQHLQTLQWRHVRQTAADALF